jgi:hypothetical protein
MRSVVMSARKLTDKNVRGVLECLEVATGSLSAHEMAFEYNKRYPPWRIGKITFAKKSVKEVSEILEFLRSIGYASRELFSFTNEALDKPVNRYRLTHEGMQYHATLKR